LDISANTGPIGDVERIRSQSGADEPPRHFPRPILGVNVERNALSASNARDLASGAYGTAEGKHEPRLALGAHPGDDRYESIDCEHAATLRQWLGGSHERLPHIDNPLMDPMAVAIAEAHRDEIEKRMPRQVIGSIVALDRLDDRHGSRDAGQRLGDFGSVSASRLVAVSNDDDASASENLGEFVTPFAGAAWIACRDATVSL
jgi:hypothetical protein